MLQSIGQNFTVQYTLSAIHPRTQQSLFALVWTCSMACFFVYKLGRHKLPVALRCACRLSAPPNKVEYKEDKDLEEMHVQKKARADQSLRTYIRSRGAESADGIWAQPKQNDLNNM